MTWPSFQFDIGLDLFPMLAGLLAAVGCGLLGNFLVLRRLSLMGDAISHSVLPGLVIAFLVVSSRDPLAMFLGAAIAGVATVVLVEVVKRLGRVEPGAAMGVVFSVLFALGVLLIERASLRHIDLDADCVLHGQLETLVWFGAPDSFGDLLTASTLEAIPRQIVMLAVMVASAFALVAVLFKELRLAAFDPSLATTQGFNATVLHYVLMVFVAAATVASFEAVGSILVIAMLICPAATARLLTDRLGTQIACSIGAAVLASIGGYIAATAVPSVWGLEPVNAAGMMTVVGGGLLVLAILFAPSHGVLMRTVRRRRLAESVAVDDLVATLFRLRERDAFSAPRRQLHEFMPAVRLDRVVASGVRRGLVQEQGGDVMLTNEGVLAGRAIVRRHRLWETWLVDEAGVSADHVHDTAEQLEHLGPEPDVEARIDPHGRNIPMRD